VHSGWPLHPRQRFEAALKGVPVDRPPVTAWGHDFLAEWSPGALAESTVRRARQFGFDLIKLQPRASCFAEAFGSVYRVSGGAFEAPRLVSWPIRRPDDWQKLIQADAGAAPLADQIRALDVVVREIGDERPVLQTVFSPFTVASYLAADGQAEAQRSRPDLIAKAEARAVAHLRQRPDAFASALGVVTSALVAFVEGSVAAGAHAIFYAVGAGASAETLSWSEYEELLLPHDRTVLAAVPASVPVVLHLCGPRVRLRLADALRIDAISLAAHEAGNPSLAQVRARTGAAVFGGVPHVAALVDGEVETVRGVVRAAIVETGGAGLVVAPGCSVPPGAPERNLVAMVSAAGGERGR